METYSNITIAAAVGDPIVLSETYVRVSDVVKMSPQTENFYVYYNGETESDLMAEKDIVNSTVNDALYNGGNANPLMIFNNFSGENATYVDGDGNAQQLPIGMYFVEDLYTKNGERVYGISVNSSVTDPATDLIVVWVPPILDDPVYNFLKNQKTTSVASGFPLRWRTKDTTSDYGRVGYSTRVSTKKTIQLPGNQDSV